MFPELRLLHKEVKVFDRMAAAETYVIIVAKDFWIVQTVKTYFAQSQVSMPIMEDISFNHLNTERCKVKLAIIAIVELLKSSLIPAPLMLC